MRSGLTDCFRVIFLVRFSWKFICVVMLLLWWWKFIFIFICLKCVRKILLLLLLLSLPVHYLLVDFEVRFNGDDFGIFWVDIVSLFDLFFCIELSGLMSTRIVSVSLLRLVWVLSVGWALCKTYNLMSNLTNYCNTLTRWCLSGPRVWLSLVLITRWRFVSSFHAFKL